MPLIMEKYKSPDPLNIVIFGSDTVVVNTQDIAHLIDKTWFRHGSLLHLLKIHLSHLIFHYVTDNVETQIIIMPKSYFLKVTFRRPNCSYVQKAIRTGNRQDKS
jgi:hypothetical protein